MQCGSVIALGNPAWRDSMGRIIKFFAAGLLVVSAAQAARAVPTYDQSFAGPYDVANVNGLLYRAQTFTVGVSGLLTRFEVAMSGSGASLFEVWSAPSGVPQAIPGTPLASATVFFNGTGFVGTEISSFGLNVTAGEILALVQVGNSSTGFGSWQGTFAGGYLGGSFFSTVSTMPGGAWNDLEQDGGFRTFVDAAVPEPSILALVGLGLAGIRYNRSRLENHRTKTAGPYLGPFAFGSSALRTADSAWVRSGALMLFISTSITPVSRRHQPNALYK